MWFWCRLISKIVFNGGKCALNHKYANEYTIRGEQYLRKHFYKKHMII